MAGPLPLHDVCAVQESPQRMAIRRWDEGLACLQAGLAVCGSLSSLKISHFFPPDLFSSAARSSSDTRASMSSTSMALMVCDNTLSAALTFVDAGVAGSASTFSSTEAAALEAYCSRATV